jgi:hypothetical protein
MGARECATQSVAFADTAPTPAPTKSLTPDELNKTSSPGRPGRSCCFPLESPTSRRPLRARVLSSRYRSRRPQAPEDSVSQHRRCCRLDRNNPALLACTSAHVRWAPPQHINRPFRAVQLASGLSSDHERPPPPPSVKHCTPRAARQTCRHQQATKTTRSSI